MQDPHRITLVTPSYRGHLLLSRQACVHSARRRNGDKSTSVRRAFSIHRSFKLPLLVVLIGWLSLCVSGCGTVLVGKTDASTGASPSGGGSSASLVVSTSSIAFGSVAVGQTATASVLVTNNGSSAVQLSSPQIAGQYFSLVQPSSGTVSIAGGNSQSFELQFAPMVPGTQTGSMTLTTGSDTLTVVLSGTGETAPGALSGLTCINDSMTGAGTDSCTVILTAPAGSGGLTVALSSSISAVSVPTSVTVASGATSASFMSTISSVTIAQKAILTAAASGATDTYTIDLGAAVPALTLSAASLNFGSVTLNTRASQSVILSSSGTAPLTISSGTLTGTGFSMSAVSFPLTLDPGQTVALQVGFDPTDVGSVSGALVLATNAGTETINLSATGEAAAGTLSGLSCSSGSVTGAATDACTVLLTAAAPSGGLIVQLSSSSAAITVPSMVTVPAGAASAGFNAMVSSAATAQAVTITASVGTMFTSLTLRLNAAILALSINATSVAFGDVEVNTQATQPVTLTSTGTVPVTINGATVTGTGFTLSGAGFPDTLAPGQATTLYVEFDPSEVGAATGQLTISSNASTNATAVVDLTGTGTVVAIAVTPANATVATGAAQQFAASVTGSSENGVTWTVSGSGCSGTTCGTMSSAGLYTAPVTVPSPATVTVTATSISDSTTSASASVVIIPAQVFRATSPWNTPAANLPAVSYSPVGTAISGSVTNPSISPWSKAGWVAIYSAQVTDPTVQLYFNPNTWTNIANGTWLNSGNSPAVEATILASSSAAWPTSWNYYSTTDVTGKSQLPPASYHLQQNYYWTPTPRLPASALPADGADGHLAVFQPNGWVLETFATIRLSNGDIVCGYASYTWSQSDGTGFQDGRRASMIPNYAGVIRNGELTSGIIRHALALSLPQKAIARTINWPAYAVDMNNSYSGSAIPFGALLVIPANITNATLGIKTPLGVAIANAVRTYGAYVVDSTSSGSIIFDTEAGATDLPPWSSAAEADLRSIINALELASVRPGRDSIPASEIGADAAALAAQRH